MLFQGFLHLWIGYLLYEGVGFPTMLYGPAFGPGEHFAADLFHVEIISKNADQVENVRDEC